MTVAGTGTTSSWDVAAVADTLLEAERTATARASIAKEWDGLDVATAYEVQDLALRRRHERGERTVGVKLGLTSKAKQAQAKIERDFARRDKELQELGARLRSASEKLDKDAAVLAESDRARRQREIAEMERDYQRRQREFREDLNQRRNEELAAVLDKANKAIKEIAEREKFDLILQEGTGNAGLTVLSPQAASDLESTMEALLADPTVAAWQPYTRTDLMHGTHRALRLDSRARADAAYIGGSILYIVERPGDRPVVVSLAWDSVTDLGDVGELILRSLHPEGAGPAAWRRTRGRPPPS